MSAWKFQISVCWIFLVACLTAVAWSRPADSGGEAAKRAVRVEDAITMSRLADTIYSDGGSARGRVAQFSPDGKQFVVVLKKGNLERNTNDYSILLFRVTRSARTTSPILLLTMSSRANDPAVTGIKWFGDNRTVAFIGAQNSTLQQVYSFDTVTKKLSVLTHEPRSIRAFDVSADGRIMLFTEDRASRLPSSPGINQAGIVVSKQSLLNLLDLSCPARTLLPEQEKDVFLQTGQRKGTKIHLRDAVFDYSTVSLSRDGRYGLIKTFVRRVPEAWTEYENAFVQRFSRQHQAVSVFPRYVVLNTRTGVITAPVDGPSELHQEGTAWAPNGHAFILSGTFLPLNIENPEERRERQRSTYVVEVDPRTGKVSTVSRSKLKISGWDRSSRRILLESAYWWKKEPPAVYEEVPSGWMQAPVLASDLAGTTPFRVCLKEGMNAPPVIVGTDPKTSQQFPIFDLNPQLADVSLAKVEYIRWKAKDGREVEGGLYVPPTFQQGRRYPLVIQTHGFTQDRFWVDGPFTSVFAAQALAAKGILVLQVGGSTSFDDFQYSNTADEAPRQMGAYEGAIDYLDERGWIDRKRVGLIGFSRTVLAVEYTLTHSSYPFAAAIVADGFDGGYFQSFVFADLADYAAVNGGPASGKSLSLWIKRAPGFNLDRVQTPIRIETYGPGSLFTGWEWFVGLTKLGKPVEYVYYPNAAHLLVKPRDRQQSLKGTVDWFCEWLKGAKGPPGLDESLSGAD